VASRIKTNLAADANKRLMISSQPMEVIASWRSEVSKRAMAAATDRMLPLETVGKAVLDA